MHPDSHSKDEEYDDGDDSPTETYRIDKTVKLGNQYLAAMEQCHFMSNRGFVQIYHLQTNPYKERPKSVMKKKIEELFRKISTCGAADTNITPASIRPACLKHYH